MKKECLIEVAVPHDYPPAEMHFSYSSQVSFKKVTLPNWMWQLKTRHLKWFNARITGKYSAFLAGFWFVLAFGSGFVRAASDYSLAIKLSRESVRATTAWAQRFEKHLNLHQLRKSVIPKCRR
jgi:demethoxyubiquinone hydroxylase (CLK1/Coq7/Cat5 family)